MRRFAYIAYSVETDKPVDRSAVDANTPEEAKKMIEAKFSYPVRIEWDGFYSSTAYSVKHY